jgi:hypothetical protein
MERKMSTPNLPPVHPFTAAYRKRSMEILSSFHDLSSTRLHQAVDRKELGTMTSDDLLAFYREFICLCTATAIAPVAVNINGGNPAQATRDVIEAVVGGINEHLEPLGMGVTLNYEIFQQTRN